MHHPPELPPLGTLVWQLAAVFALVLANGFFVATEFALVAVRRTRIDQMAAEGSNAALVVQKAVHNLDRYIAATQVGITIASLLLGGIGERTLEPIFNSFFSWLGMPEKWQGVTRVGIATGMAYFIMTAMHVVIGELMPKSIALQKPEAVSLLVGRPMTFCAKVFAPLIWMLNGTGNFLLRLMGVHAVEGHQQVHSPEELDLLFTQAHEGGQLTETERDILHRVVKFSDLTAREVMVPRVEVQGIPVEMSRADLAALIHGQPHTRTPVYHGSLDDVVGIVHIKDLVRLEVEQGSLNNSAAGSDGRQNVAIPGSANGERAEEQMINLMSIVREAPRVPETVTIDKMLIEFKNRRQQMAIVIDEYGGTSGIITMGDLLDQVFGDVHDEFDQPEPEIAPRADGRIQLSGSVRIDEVNELYSTGFRTDQVDTMAGLVLDELGRPAVVGDEVEVNRVNLRVEAVGRLRITTLSLRLPAETE